MGFQLVGRVWNEEEFKSYLQTVNLSWASGITIHHTWNPSLADRPEGFKAQHLINLRSYYQSLGWDRGPHLFVDEDQIWGMSSLHERGIHAISYNRSHVAIEVLGNYDSEPVNSGRGEQCWQMAAKAAAAIISRAGWSVDVINEHRSDPQTNKTCPGRNLNLNSFRQEVNKNINPDCNKGNSEAIKTAIESIEWQLNKIKKII